MTIETYTLIAGKPTISKDPNETLDYSVNWTDYLAAEGDFIATSSWVVSAGINKVSSSNTSIASAVYISGGTAGNTESATCTITTTGGRVVERSIFLKIEDR